ncbi:MAG: hypothetical protein ACI9OU_002366 [Candidatus Promineifilaceae bacterium]
MPDKGRALINWGAVGELGVFVFRRVTMKHLNRREALVQKVVFALPATILVLAVLVFIYIYSLNAA